MSSRGNLQRKCAKGHPRAAGRCSSRWIRWYPRLELPRSPDGRRRFEALGGYPTRAQAEAAMADALARQVHGLTLDPAKLTINQYLDRWLAHIRGSLRARNTALLGGYVRPCIGARLLKQLTPLEVQAIYDQLAVSGRRDGKPGGLAPQRILAVHRCLHRALAQAVTWRLVARNIATDGTPPPLQTTEVVALAPEQVAVQLDAAEHAPSPWLETWTMLAATGARNGELCGLEWTDLDPDAGTIRFRQALTSIDPAVLPEEIPGADERRKELAVGPVKSAASNAILTLPPFAVQALRHHRRQQARFRLALGQPATVELRYVEPGRPPGRSSWTWCSAPNAAPRSTPTTPAAPSPAWPPASGWPPTPHMLRHALASAMAAHKEPASIIAAQLRHADGGASPNGSTFTSSPDRAQTGRTDRGRVRPCSPGRAVDVGISSGGGNLEGNLTPRAPVTRYVTTAFPQLRGGVAGTGFEPV